MATERADGDGVATSTAITRRDVLKLGGVVVLVAGAGALLQACKDLSPAAPTALATATPAPTETPLPTALPPTPTSLPTASPRPAPAPTPLPPTALPSATPTRVPLTSTPSPTPLPPSTPAVINPQPSGERAWLAHLLRRAGFGASQGELDRFQSMGLTPTVDYLLNYESVDDSALEARILSLNLDLTRPQDLERWWLVRMLYTKRPLQEKMVLFWHGLLTSGISKVQRADRMLNQNQLFRQQALGQFDVLLKAISRDPAMLVWLDSESNRRQAPNENFARELMELFSLGVGNYTETDVRESARAFTGYFLTNQGFVFNPQQHDNGLMTFLGQTGTLNGDDVVDIIVRQPTAARYIARRLFTFFAYENPPALVVDRFAQIFIDNKRSIKALVRAILTSDEFYSPQAYRARPKSPVEYVVGIYRTLDLETNGQGLPLTLQRMGQEVFDPPDVAGWPGGANWINSSTLLERLNAANAVAVNRRLFLPRAPLAATATAQQTADYYMHLLVDGVLPADAAAHLNAYGVATANQGVQDAGLRSFVYLLLSSPTYQMA